jgi:hypothetical protein
MTHWHVSALRLAALVVNVGLLGFGVWLQFQPQRPGDTWAAGALCVIAAVNASAVLTAGRRGGDAHLRGRLQRIAMMANLGLIGVGVALAAGSMLQEGPGGVESLSTLALVGPPLLTAVAILAARSQRPRAQAPPEGSRRSRLRADD